MVAKNSRCSCPTPTRVVRYIVLGSPAATDEQIAVELRRRQINTTFSAGIATLRADENGHALLRRADDVLYSAKNGGRNLIKLAN
jgi:PleD family two-component response regulator